MGDAGGDLPYWRVNVPESEQEISCPEYLCNLSKKDIEILSTLSATYVDLTWPEVREIVRTHQLQLLQRRPADLRRYLKFNYQTKESYGSVFNFIIKERVKWTTPVIPAGTPFENDEDLSVKYNDWGYGIDEKVIHLVVWTKFNLEEDETTGNLKPQVKAAIDRWVNQIFCRRMPDDRVIWFKNWTSLKSVHALEHFHVMLYDPDPSFVSELTREDEPVRTGP